ncbi:MAG: phenylalanine--tRNA ligase subunit alpha [Candidatus Lokiarchaeota archaeon]|nr:phenylalanine--tRNA ligase subunit alpha [Candidatus Lokiarchaeota archaeon]
MSVYDVDILNVLKKEKDYISASELARKCKLNIEQVNTIIPRLKYYNAIDIREDINTYLFLTSEGEKYLKNGLPEVRLIEFLKEKQKISTNELKECKLEDYVKKIGMNWARKLGLITFKKENNETFIVLEGKGNELDEKVSSRRDFTGLFKTNNEVRLEKVKKEFKDIIEEFKDRGLLDSRKEIFRFVKINKDTNIEDFQIEKISKITQDMIKERNLEELKNNLKEFDITTRPKVIYAAKRQPYLEFLDEVRELLIGLGFKEYHGPFVEAEFYNFDCLNQAQDHPAREIHDSYILKQPTTANLEKNNLVERVKLTHENGWKTGSTGWGYNWSFDLARRLILRSQTTSVSVRTILKEKKPPIKMFVLDKVFRPDVLDAKHAQEFYQCEGIVLGENLNLRNLLGVLEEFGMQMGFEGIKFKPGFFPFTSPSVEAFVKHKKLGWIEILGSGLFRPEVLIPLGIDYPKVQCLAWGIGIGRLAMVRLGLDDIRTLHSQDLNYLRRSKIVMKKDRR